MSGLRYLFLMLVLVACRDNTTITEEENTPSYKELRKTADSLFEQGVLDEAIVQYRNILSHYPDSSGVHHQLYRAYMGLGMFPEAENSIARSASRADTISRLRLYSRYALLGLYKGDTTLIRTYNDSLQKLAFHTYPRPYRYVAFYDVFLRRFDKAIGALERFTLYGNYEHTPLNLGFLYLKQGDTTRGMPIIRDAEKRLTKQLLANPANEDGLWEMTEVAVILGDTTRAMAYLNQALAAGLGKQWWIYHMLAPESVPDPVFEPLEGHPDFIRIRDSLLRQRLLMKTKVTIN